MPGAGGSLNAAIVAAVVVIFVFFWNIDNMSDVVITGVGAVKCRIQGEALAVWAGSSYRPARASPGKL
jgi:hypothetical protein